MHARFFGKAFFAPPPENLIILIKIKSCLKSFWQGIVKNGCGQSGLWTLKLTVSQGGSDGTN